MRPPGSLAENAERQHGSLEDGTLWRGDDPDRDVLLLARRDGKRAFGLLASRHWDTIFRYCYEQLGDPVLADDVRQQVFIAAHQALATFAGRSGLRTWLFGIARHRVLDAVRQRNRERQRLMYTNLQAIPDESPSPDDQLAQSRVHEALRECLKQIKGPSRVALLLRYEEGFTFEEMAKILGEPANTLRVRVMRALPELRNRLETY